MNTPQATTGTHKMVMVIDDNPIDRYIAEVTIKRSAFAQQVICKESAMSALDYLQANANSAEELPSIIFLDINMPDVNGFGFLDEFSTLPSQVKEICDVIMLSSSIDPQDYSRVELNAYVSRFFNKPLQREKLAILMEIKPDRRA